jgi:hypothetical protein
MPYVASARISFFPVEPAQRLDARRVWLAALVTDSNCCGFNLLLRRLPDEQYGEWVVCRVSMNAVSVRSIQMQGLRLDSAWSTWVAPGPHADPVYQRIAVRVRLAYVISATFLLQFQPRANPPSQPAIEGEGQEEVVPG